MYENKNRLTTKELAELWGYHPGTLKNWRSQGIGPDYVQLRNGKVFYKLEAILEYEKANTQVNLPKYHS